MDLYNNADLLQMILAALGSNRGGPNLEISGDPGAQAQSNFYASPNVNSYSFSAPPATYTYNVQAPQQSAGSLSDLLKLFGGTSAGQGAAGNKSAAPPAPTFVDPNYYANVMKSNSGGVPITTTAPANVTQAYGQQFLGQSPIYSGTNAQGIKTIGASSGGTINGVSFGSGMGGGPSFGSGPNGSSFTGGR